MGDCKSICRKIQEKIGVTNGKVLQHAIGKLLINTVCANQLPLVNRIMELNNLDKSTRS